MRSLIRRVAAASALVLALPLLAAAPAEAAAPPLQVTRAAVQAALTCTGDLAASKRRPVLFLHGTTSNSKANWSWNWNRELRQRDWAHCNLDTPESGNEDIQVAAEYIVRAIRIMHHRAGRDIDLVGHSQGGMIGRWALKYWPRTRGMVDDYVGLASSNHGTELFAGQCQATQSCTAANWQQQAGSNFLTVLNEGRETYRRVDYTAISTDYDEVVVPSTSAYLSPDRHLANVTNVAVQQVCPTETVEHFAMAYSNAAWLIGLDALIHRGPAAPGRVDTSTCGAPYMPGVDPVAFPTNVADALAQTVSSSASAPKYPKEPRVRCYARSSCG